MISEGQAEAVAATIRAGTSVREAARQAGLTDRTLQRQAQRDPGLRAILRQAVAHGATARLAPHGTAARYEGPVRCRCDLCRAGNAQRHREQRARRMARGTGPPEHGASAYNNWDCRCPVCTAANTERNRPAQRRYQARLRATAGQPSRRGEATLADRTATRQSLNAMTLDRAHRHRYEWTGPELELAARRDLPVRHVALMLGRTYYAVGTKRARLRADPANISRAGRAAKAGPPEHGVSGYRNWGCRCPVCIAAQRAAWRANERSDKRRAAKKAWTGSERNRAAQRIRTARYRASDRGKAAMARRRKARNDLTLDRARRNGYEWTGPELELAARDDLTARQAAFMLGRTCNAVCTKRRLLRADPRTISLAGLTVNVPASGGALPPEGTP